MARWLIKSEPDTFSILDLAKASKQTTSWEGVRNYQARNFLRAMKRGDLAIYYHSNAEPPAAVGIAKVVREAYPDPTAWDPESAYHDPKASPDNPSGRWWMCSAGRPGSPCRRRRPPDGWVRSFQESAQAAAVTSG